MKKLFTIGLLLLCQFGAIAQNYTVTAFSNQPGACRFDMFNSRGTYTFDAKAPEGPTLQIAAGQEATVDVFPVTGFVLDSLVADGTQLTIVSAGYNNGKRGYFTMPDHNVSVMAYLHYAPTLPPNPSESGWDETTASEDSSAGNTRGQHELDAAGFLALPYALRGEVAMRYLTAVCGRRKNLKDEHAEMVERLCESSVSAEATFPYGVTLVRTPWFDLKFE